MYHIILRSRGYRLSQLALDELGQEGIAPLLLTHLQALKDKRFASKKVFIDVLQEIAPGFLEHELQCILKAAKIFQAREILRYMSTRPLYAAIRHWRWVNALLNRLRFPRLSYGQNVLIKCRNKHHFIFSKNQYIGHKAKLMIGNSRLVLKNDVSIHANSYIAPERRGIQIGERTRLQEGARVLGEVDIGADVIVAPQLYVSSGTHVFNKEPYLLINRQDERHDGMGEMCVIEDDCWIGINVCIMPGVRIRRGCIIGAGAVVTRSTEPYAIYGGIPAKKIGTRFSLDIRHELDAQRKENLPYFYEGFDHYHFLEYSTEYGGICTNASSFRLYTVLPKIDTLSLSLSVSSAKAHLQHQGRSFELQKGKQTLLMHDIEPIENLISFKTNEKLIIHYVKFETY